ncbi:GTPase IMAP family member 8 [Cebidichthys violaceus]|uniref:GTPase IMAP family member 8 n=1 Tax=Cebidichthys violaceus TaxID=271503 RepID=UPI0035CCA02F
MATSRLSAWHGGCASQLRIILLGGRNCGKSSVGNLILGKEEFVTKERTSCSRRLGAVAGRWLTVVDTPGWWCDFSSQDTSELVKREIVSSVSLCAPGPHVFLITIKASSGFSEKRRRAVEEHVALLGERVWSHCMVVFASADGAKHTGAEELVQRGGKALRWLSGKCGQRCHSVISGDDTEVTELLEKIQKLVTGNGVFKMQESVLQATAEEKRRVEERARQRFVRMKKDRFLMRESLRPVSYIRIVLVGAKGSGKSSTLNTILSRESGLRARTARCLVEKGVVFGRQVTVVDTPGWWMNYFCDESPVFDRRELLLGSSLCPPGPHVFLLVIRVDRAFTETYRRAAEEHLRLIGDHIWSRVIVLFSFGDWLGGTTTEQCIESEGEPLRWLVERCGNRYHVLNNQTKGDGFQVRELIGKIEEMLAGCNGCQHHGIEKKVVEELEEEMSRENERAKERLMRKEKQRKMARFQLEKLNPITELRIVLIGGRKTGRSSCGDTILGRECFHKETQTASCSEKQATISGKTVAVLDTPGCFSVTSDLLQAPSCVILLVVNVSSSFDADHVEATEKQLEAGGGQMWSRAAVLFSHGDWLGDTSIEQRIESEGEPLQRLVERCGNRYHVLDNRHRGDGAQVNELIDLIEETLVEDRLAILHRGDHMWIRDSLRDVTLCEKDRQMITRCRRQLSHDLTESDNPTTQTSLNRSGGPESQIVALPAGRTARPGLNILERDRFLSCLASMLSGEAAPRWTMNLPVWLPTDDLRLRLNGARRPFSSTHPTVLLVVPQTQHRMLAEENGLSVHSLCQPALRGRTLRRLSEAGGLQALIDQWDDSSLEELEAFIDSYFEMIWEQTMGSFQEPVRPTAKQEAVVEEEEKAGQQEVLSSIDRKLSKLELLEEIKMDLAELRTSLENSWRAIQDLREKSEQGDDHVDTKM